MLCSSRRITMAWRQRHAMRSFHLHGRGRHDPDGLIEIDLLPARKPQFAGPDEPELKRQPGRRLAPYFVTRA
jgi:hypothetical protein